MPTKQDPRWANLAQPTAKTVNDVKTMAYDLYSADMTDADKANRMEFGALHNTNPDFSENNSSAPMGELNGYSRRISENQVAVYDQDGKYVGVGSSEGGGWMGKHGQDLAKLSIAAMGAYGAYAGLTGTSLAGSATGVAAGTEAFIPAANAFTFESLGGAMAVPEIAGVTAAEMGGAAAGLGGAAPTVFNAAADSQLANVAIQSAGGDALSAYTAAGINPATNPAAANWFTSTFGEAGVAGWIKSNPELSKLLFSTVGGAVAAIGASGMADKANQNRIDVANIAATNNLDVTKLKDQQTQDANKRYSASVSGINYGGLINSTPKPLTRNDGTRVFGSTGLINRG